MAENPIADILLNGNNQYTTYAARQNIFKTFMEQQRERADLVYAQIVSDDDLERIEQLLTACNRIESEIDVANSEFESVIKDAETLNKEYNAAITESGDVSSFAERFIALTDNVTYALKKLEVLQTLIESYTGTLTAFELTLQEKYADEIAKLTPEDETTPQEQDASKMAEALFSSDDACAYTSCYTSTDLLDATITANEKLPTVITESEDIAYKEAVVKCLAIRNDVYEYYHNLKTQYGGSDLLNQSLAQVNNILHECEVLGDIFQCAVDNPSDWAMVSSAQAAVYRYEALQNDYKIVIDALNALARRVANGEARSISGRSIPTELSEDDYAELEFFDNIVGSLGDDIRTFMNSVTTDENLIAWVVSRYQDLQMAIDKYLYAKDGLAFEEGDLTYHTGIYDNEGFGLPVLSNARREVVLISNEIKTVVNAGKYPVY